MVTSAPSAHEFRDLEKQFRDGHRDYPELCAQGFLEDEWSLRGQGRRRYRLLAELAAKAAGYAGVGREIEYWLNLVKGYLIKHDTDNEYLQRLPAASRSKPGPWRHPRTITGEVYIIRSVFAASADHCLNIATSYNQPHGIPAKTVTGSQMPAQPTASATGNVNIALMQPSKASSHRPMVKSGRYPAIDKVLKAIAEVRPKSHAEVFRQLDKHVVYPYAAPFRDAGGWLAGFKKDPHRARAWLSKAWSRLRLPPFPRGPK